jgi:NADH-ubiquinone oxidoreductase chain 5
LGSNVDTWNSIFLVLPWHEFFFITEFLPSFIKLIPVIFSLTGAFFSFFFFQYYQYKMQNLKNYINFYSVYHFLIKKWYFDLFYNQIIAKIFLNFGYYTSFKLLDRGLFEILGPFGIVNLIKKTSYITSELQTGLIYHYILIMLLSLTLILLISILPFYFTITIFFVYIYLFIYLRITSIKYE